MSRRCAGKRILFHRARGCVCDVAHGLIVTFGYTVSQNPRPVSAKNADTGTGHPAYARTIAQPQPPSWPLLLRYLQPFASPDPLHSILAHRPPRMLQQRRDASVAVPPILHRQGQDPLRQLIFVRAPQRLIALCSSPLPHHSACPPLTHFVLLKGMLHGAPTSLRA